MPQNLVSPQKGKKPVEISDRWPEDDAADYLFCGDSGYCAWFSRGNCPFQRCKKRNQEAGKDEREGRIYQKAAGVLPV